MLTSRSLVFHGESHLGELDVVPVKDQEFEFPKNEIRIHHLSPGSERCPPLSILQTISSFSLRCKLHSTLPIEQRHLIDLHACCFHELKTAVVLGGDEEIHLVAMRSKMKNFPCFWCYSAPRGLYASCLGMLNLRCLAIVFDLDETLIVANTMKSFEDRIETLNVWLARETDPMRISGMSAERKRYLDDRVLLKQYAETDTVVDSGRLYKVHPEEVPPLSDGHQRIIRPVIRLQEKNVVFTRINPENRDTSVLVRLRPAWEELKSYLTANRRKRFEVFVCTMAERDYALEMWRLLDQDANLIDSKQLLDRITCVKSGSRKSLQSVFLDGACHPKMALVIDDRLKVWEEKDQNRVHVVPAFTPYYAPQAETAHVVPVLCVARNVACNVRGGFFKEFDDNLLRQIDELCFEDDIVNLPNVPDAGNFLMFEDCQDTGFMPNGSTNVPIAEGMSGGEVERRLNHPNVTGSTMHLMSNGIEPRHDISKHLAATSRPGVSRPVLPSQKPGLLGPPGRRDGLSSDTDLDAKRRYLVMKHGQDLRNHSLLEPPLIPRSTPVSRAQHQGGWLNEEAGSAGVGIRTSGLTQESAPFQPSLLGQPNLGNEKQKHLTRQTQANTLSSQNRTLLDRGRVAKTNMVDSSSFVAVLIEIGRKCGSHIEFKSIISTSKDLQFSFEVLFTGEKIGQGMGKTRKDAQQQAAENALHSLAEKYRAGTWCGAVQTNSVDLSRSSENGFIWEDSGDEADNL